MLVDNPLTYKPASIIDLPSLSSKINPNEKLYGFNSPLTKIVKFGMYPSYCSNPATNSLSNIFKNPALIAIPYACV